jgi:hypothetical protein
MGVRLQVVREGIAYRGRFLTASSAVCLIASVTENTER